jgi:hypothetical protein
MQQLFIQPRHHDEAVLFATAPLASLVLPGSRRTRRGQIGQQVRSADSLQKRLVALDLRACIRNCIRRV